MRYPQAHILVEAFNSTWPKANGKFNWTLSQIVEQSYVWADDTDKIGKGKVCSFFSCVCFVCVCVLCVCVC